MTSKIAQQLIEEFNRRIHQENIPRIKKCLIMLNEEQIWYAHNPSVNSIGNLILHLCGNVNQWIGSGIGKIPDHRKRDEEFRKGQKIDKKTLIFLLEELRKVTDKALEKLTTLDLEEKLIVQGFSEKPTGVIVHVIEHFSYHTGQIAQMTKILCGKDLGFYDGIDLNKKTKA